MKNYKVLWIDDEFEKLEPFSKLAHSHDIFLEGYKSFEEGFINFSSKVYEYDAILLDALFFKTKTQVSGSEDSQGLSAAKDKIAEFRRQRNIPYFILSGQTQLAKDSTFAATYGNHFKKQNPEDIKRLFQEIKEAADNEPYTRIRHKYQNVFDVCTKNYIGEDSAKYLLDILFSIENEKDKFDDELYFTQIRIILESMFRASNRLGFLQDKCVAGRVNLAESSLYMSGEPTKHLGVQSQKPHFTKLISDSVKSILFITGAASHTTEAETKNNINLQEYRKTIATPYLLYSLTFQLMDVLIWFKNYTDSNPDYAINIAQWKNLTSESASDVWISGKIVKLAENGFGTFQPNSGGKNISIPPTMMRENKLIEDQQIEIKTKLDTTGTKTLIQDLRI